ncbi:MAG: hypothetical protein K8Q97_03735 [Candidatus Andersenbacteria bacterium]|nr:hypothetical protein [Candidatus Andersenbacteria bacterium]
MLGIIHEHVLREVADAVHAKVLSLSKLPYDQAVRITLKDTRVVIGIRYERALPGSALSNCGYTTIAYPLIAHTCKFFSGCTGHKPISLITVINHLQPSEVRIAWELEQ